MCMKYVNVSVQCFDRTPLRLKSASGVSSIIDSVKYSTRDNKIVLGKFDIVAFINIRGTSSGDNEQNPIDKKAILDFCIRLTLLDEHGDNQISYDLKDFTIDLSNKDILHKASFVYAEQVEVINVDGFELDKPGHYVIKILVKESGSEKYDVQLVHSLHIIE